MERVINRKLCGPATVHRNNKTKNKNSTQYLVPFSASRKIITEQFKV